MHLRDRLITLSSLALAAVLATSDGFAIRVLDAIILRQSRAHFTPVGFVSGLL